MRPSIFHWIILFSALIPAASCVSTGKFNAAQKQEQQYDSLYNQAMRTLKSCQDVNKDLVRQKDAIRNKANDLSLQLNVTKENNTQLGRQLKDLSAISTAQAESLQKSIDNIGTKDAYLQSLHTAVSGRDATNLALLMDLKATFGSFDAQEVRIMIDHGEVHIDFSDSLFFDNDTSSYTLGTKAKAVLGRLARALSDQPDLNFMVEGNSKSNPAADSSIAPVTASDSHADTTAANLPDTSTTNQIDSIANALHLTPKRQFTPVDWDFCTRRAATIVEVLQDQYHIDPARMTASGNVAPNRIRIIVFPNVDRLQDLLDHKTK